MKKYLKRWNKLTEDEKIRFFNSHIHYGQHMWHGCPGPGTSCYICKIMFPESGYPTTCPCIIYDLNIIKEHPTSVIEYCLIKDGWIEKED